MSRWLITWSVFALLPLLNAVYVILERSANRPFAEEWLDSALVAIASHDGTLTLNQLLTPQGDYPHLTTKLFVALHTPLTRYDLRLDMLLGVMLSALTLLGVVYLLWRQDRHMALLLAPFLSALIFTPRQAVNWLTGFQNVYFAFVLCIVLIILVIEVLPISWRALGLAALLTTFGALALGVAPFYWLSGLLALWLRGYRAWRYYAVWITLSAFLTVYFLSGLATSSSLSVSLSQLDRIAHFAVAFLGSPLAPIARLLIGTALGLAGIAVFAANALLLWRWRPGWLRSWMALAFFSVLSALITAYGRWFYFDGVSAYPLAERYVTNGVPFWVALLAISASNLRLAQQSAPLSTEGLPKPIALFISWLRRNIYPINSVAFLCLGVVFATSFSIAQIRLPNEKPTGECLRKLPLTRDFDCARDLAAGRSNFLPILVRADQLAVRRLGVFAGEPAVEPRFGEISVPLEYIGGGTPSEGSSQAEFITWEIKGERHSAFLQQPPDTHDWTVWFQHITAPTYFESALYVPLTKQSSQSVIFRVYGQFFLSQERKLLFERRVDPHQQREPMPIRVSLAPFLNQVGRLMLILETEGEAAQALWLEPRFVLELTEEAARAPYYPPR